MDLISFFNSRLGPMLGIFLARVLTLNGAYRFADWLANIVASRPDSPVARAVRSNQAVVRGLPYHSPELDGVVFKVFRTAARSYADWYRSLAQGPELVRSSMKIDEGIFESVQQAQDEKRGIMVVSAHMSNFNMMLMSLGLYGIPIQGLSYANVQGAVHIDNRIRKQYGLNITPISMAALKQAIDSLRNGGIVMTAVDRTDLGGEDLTFFGRQTILPIGHARLAIRTNSRVLVGMTQTVSQGQYRAVGAPIIEPEITGDTPRDIRTLAQRIIGVVEDFIRERPSEWLMFLPIWPEEIPTDEYEKGE
jgi:lauroyl/myristoyl acyltransferase